MRKAALARRQKLDLNYDAEEDVLYVNFGPLQASDDSDISDVGVILRLKEEKIIGLTILNATKRLYNTDLLNTYQLEERKGGRRQNP